MATVLGWTTDAWVAVIAAAALLVSVVAAIVAGVSARHAARSASEAERSNDIAEQLLGLERQRGHREVVDYTERVAPRWEPAKPGTQGYFYFDGSHLQGALRNEGLHAARILLAVMDFGGARVPVQTRVGHDFAWEDNAQVPPGDVLRLRCDPPGHAIGGDARPTLYVDYEAPDLDHPPFGVTVELLAKGTDHRGHRVWRVGAIRRDVRP